MPEAKLQPDLVVVLGNALLADLDAGLVGHDIVHRRQEVAHPVAKRHLDQLWPHSRDLDDLFDHRLLDNFDRLFNLYDRLFFDYLGYYRLNLLFHHPLDHLGNYPVNRLFHYPFHDFRLAGGQDWQRRACTKAG